MLKYGKVVEVDNDRCCARVEFEEDGIVSHWLQIPQAQSKSVKAFSTLEIGENVACIMDAQCEQGIVAGAIYDRTVQTAHYIKGENSVGIGTDPENYAVFRLGDKLINIQTDTIETWVNDTVDLRHKNGKLRISYDGTSFVIISNNKELYSMLYNLLTILISHTHPTAVGPSGPPTEAANLTSVRSDIQTFFG